jgi:hypothetical protein
VPKTEKQRFIVKLDKSQRSIVKRAVTLRLAKDASLDPDSEETAGEAIVAIATDYLTSQTKD